MSEISIIGKIFQIDNEKISIESELRVSNNYCFYNAKSSKKSKYLIQYFSPQQKPFYLQELQGYELISDAPHIIKKIFQFSTESFSMIGYDLPKNVEFYDTLSSLLQNPKNLSFFLNQFFDFLAFIHNKNLIYSKITEKSLFFDESFKLKIGGFSEVTKIETPLKITSEVFALMTGRSQSRVLNKIAVDCLGPSVDFFNFGEFLKLNLLGKKICRCSVKSPCETRKSLKLLTEILTNPNPSMRPGIETLKYLLNPRFFCQFNKFNIKRPSTSSKEKITLLLNKMLHQKSFQIPELLINLKENPFNFEYLNQVLIEVRSEETAFQDFTIFIKKNSINYGLTFQMLIVNLFIFSHLEPEFFKRIENFHYLDDSTCEFINRNHFSLKFKESPLKLFHKFYLLLRHKSYIIEDQLKDSSRAKIQKSRESYFKRILEFLIMVLKEHIACLFYLEDLVLVLVFQELFNLTAQLDTFPVFESSPGVLKDSREVFEDLLKKYQKRVNLNLLKNFLLWKKPLIFQCSEQSMASFHFLSRVISGDSHSVDVQLNEGSNEKLLGNGSFGAVFKREYKGISLAIKQFFEILDQQEKSFLREVSLLSQYFHPKIILLYGVNVDSEATKLVYPLMEGGDLHHLLHMSDVIFSYHQNVSMCIDLAEAVHYLHSQNVIHRDLKPLNILLEKKILSNKDPISLKLADFGLSRHVNAQMTERVGTVHWNSPEVLSGHDYTIKSDIFSLGLVFWEIFTRDIPFSDLNNDQDPFHKNINVEIINGRIPDVERIECGEKSSLIQDLVINCLSFNPEHRPSAEQVLEILMGMIEDN